jgi:hypothetical protein
MAIVDAWKGRGLMDESVQVLKEVQQLIQMYLTLRPEPFHRSHPLFVTKVADIL